MGNPGIRVTVEDLATGETESQEIRYDYVIVCGGWLEQEDVDELRLAAESHMARLLRPGLRPWSTSIRLERMERALAVLRGIEHGARIDALPSPEEEAAQEREYRESLAGEAKETGWEEVPPDA